MLLFKKFIFIIEILLCVCKFISMKRVLYENDTLNTELYQVIKIKKKYSKKILIFIEK